MKGTLDLHMLSGQLEREAAAKVFCRVMKLPPPSKRFYEFSHALINATEKVAKMSMALAATETLSMLVWTLRKLLIPKYYQGNNQIDLTATYIVMSVWQITLEIVGEWKLKVHLVSSIAQRYYTICNIHNIWMMGIAYKKAVLESKPYKYVKIKNLECVDHVEKRMGTQLKGLKLKGKRLEDKRSLEGPNRLTDAEIDKLQRYYEGGQTQAKIAQAIRVSQSVISRILNRFLETGSPDRRPGQGRRWATMPNEDRYLVLTARRHRNMSANLLQQYLRSAAGTMVSTQTVRNWLHCVGLYARRWMVCIKITSRHRHDRREGATEHVNWRRIEWSNVLFSDENRFSVHPDNRRIFIWRDRGSRNNSAFVHESVRFGGGGVLVYGGNSIHKRPDLYIVRDGPQTAHRYRDEIFRPLVVPYAAAIGDDFILMDDNCRPHRANLVEDFLFEEGIVRMEWPACYPDMNPIEHVWHTLG
ncbi:transposable element Tcb2 transposase [Trichonephila clavipes]|nr:transposable element Tcb2 transposase [Trichonephila clavipes]